MTLTLVAERLVVKLPRSDFYDLGLSRPGIKPWSPVCEENALPLSRCDILLVKNAFQYNKQFRIYLHAIITILQYVFFLILSFTLKITYSIPAYLDVHLSSLPVPCFAEETTPVCSSAASTPISQGLPRI